jgi:hypothetical protein
MDFPGAQELAQGLALELAALMEILARIQHYICVIAAVALIVYLPYAAWFRLKRIARATTLRRCRTGFQQQNSR